MIGFLIKKSFWDTWDNMLGIVVMNLLFIVVISLSLLAPSAGMAFMLPVLAAVLLLNAVFWVGAGRTNHAYTRFRRDGASAFWEGVRTSWGHVFLFWGISLLLISMWTLVIPFYFCMHNLVGYLITMLLVWFTVFLAMALMYFVPLHYELSGDRPFKTLKKCFLITFDNPGTTIFLLFNTIVLAVLSVFTVFMLPGFAGIQLVQSDCLRLLMLKYDYFEVHAEADRKDVPWEIIIADEREKVGPRSFKSMIFPWKY